jgi:hypothetical protein
MSPAEVVRGPIITEKGTLVNELGNQVVVHRARTRSDRRSRRSST